MIFPAENIILRDFFPLRSSPGTTPPPSNPSCFPAQSSPTEPLPATPLSATSTDLHPGQSYRIYHSSDILGTLPEEYEFLVRRVAKWTGVDEGYVCSVVERYERRLARWWDKIKKEEKRKSTGSSRRKSRSRNRWSDEDE